MQAVHEIFTKPGGLEGGEKGRGYGEAAEKNFEMVFCRHG